MHQENWIGDELQARPNGHTPHGEEFYTCEWVEWNRSTRDELHAKRERARNGAPRPDRAATKNYFL